MTDHISYHHSYPVKNMNYIARQIAYRLELNHFLQLCKLSPDGKSILPLEDAKQCTWDAETPQDFQALYDREVAISKLPANARFDQALIDKINTLKHQVPESLALDPKYGHDLNRADSFISWISAKNLDAENKNDTIQIKELLNERYTTIEAAVKNSAKWGDKIARAAFCELLWDNRYFNAPKKHRIKQCNSFALNKGWGDINVQLQYAEVVARTTHKTLLSKHFK